MRLAEPMTLLTDYLLGALGAWLGLRLWRSAPASGDPRRTWAATFWAMALAAVLGGTSHGFEPYFGDGVDRALWNATLLAIGVASGLLLMVGYQAVSRGSALERWERPVRWVIAAEVAVYAWRVCFVDNDFRTAVAQYGGAMVLVLAAHLVLAGRRRAGAWWIVGGFVVSFLAAGIQQAELAPHPSFNHNDLYHVVQMLGLWFLYLGARFAGRN